MKKLLFVLTAVVFLSIASAPNAIAGGPFDTVENYYSDSTFSSCVGWTEQACDDSVDYGGTVTNFRLEDRVNCSTQNVITTCQAWNSTTSSWDYISCPVNASEMGRLRIPVG